MSIKTNKKPICKKGVNKANGFPGCGSEAYKLQYGLCQSCLYDWMKSTDAGKVEYQKRYNALKFKKVKEEKKENREQKNKLKNWSAELQNKINLIARLIDKGLPCLATGINAKQIHGGHIFARGGNQTIRFNLHNIHRQSAQSNHWQNNLSDPDCSRHHCAVYYEHEDKTSFIDIYPRVFETVYKSEKEFINYDLEGDKCQLTHWMPLPNNPI